VSGQLRFAGGKSSSTSGFLIPQYYAFLKNNILYEQHFKSLSMGSHQENFLAVAQKKADIATNNTDDLAQLKQKFPKEYAQVKVIWESPAITFDPIIQRRDLSPELKQKIASFFFSYGKSGSNMAEQKRKLNAADQLDGFLPSNNSQLRPVSDLQLFHDRFRLSLNNKISDVDKFNQEKQLYQRYEKLAKLLAK
jgi:phosphonate transport system substrate-binding protein